MLIALALMMLAGCASTEKSKWWQWPFGKKTKTVASTDTELPPPPEAAPPVKTGDVSALPLDKAPTDKDLSIPEPTPIREAPRAAETSELATVFFAFDSSELDPAAESVLDKNAEWLTLHSDVNIQIEGHTDSRGTIEYNYNLGQRRANSVKAYLINKGIDAGRLHTISYGEERPVDPAETEQAWSQNRRAQFLIY